METMREMSLKEFKKRSAKFERIVYRSDNQRKHNQLKSVKVLLDFSNIDVNTSFPSYVALMSERGDSILQLFDIKTIYFDDSSGLPVYIFLLDNDDCEEITLICYSKKEGDGDEM